MTGILELRSRISVLHLDKSSNFVGRMSEKFCRKADSSVDRLVA